MKKFRLEFISHNSDFFHKLGFAEKKAAITFTNKKVKCKLGIARKIQNSKYTFHICFLFLF